MAKCECNGIIMRRYKKKKQGLESRAYEGPGGAVVAKGSWCQGSKFGREAIQERTQECMTGVMTDKPDRRACQGPGGASIAKARCAKAAARRTVIQERTQECMTEIMTEGIAPCGGPGGASIAKARCAKAAAPEGCGLKNA